MTDSRKAGRWLALLLGMLAGTTHAAIDPDDLLPVDDAFALQAEATPGGAIGIRWDIADGYYLYRHRTSVAADAGFAAGELRLPAGTPYEDEFFGKVETYRGRLIATLPGQARAASTTPQAAAMPIAGAPRTARSRICSESPRTIAAGIADKMVRRHPHIFGDAAERPDWEAMKRQEREGRGGQGRLFKLTARNPSGR